MHRLLSLTVALALSLAAGPPPSAPTVKENAAKEDTTDWPQWRGPHRDGVSTEKGLLKEWPEKGPELLWNSKDVNGGKSVGTGYSTISVANGKIYTMGDQDKKGCVFCLDEKTGKLLWTTPMSPENTGDYPGPRCIPTVDGNRVYALSRQGILACLDADKGDILWKKDFRDAFKGSPPHWGYSESPLIDGDKVVCTPGSNDAALVALNKMTGEVIWKSAIKGAGGAAYSSIVIADVGGVRQYINLVGSQEKGLVSVNAANGKFLWNYGKAAGGIAQIPTAVVKGDRVFTSTGYGGGAAILQMVPDGDGIKIKELHHFQGNKLQIHVGGYVLVGDHIYGGHGHNDGKPFCLDFNTGKLAWGPLKESPGGGDAGVVYADGNIYARYKNNVMAMFAASPDGYKLVSKFKLPKELNEGPQHEGWPHPVVVHGRLYIRGPEQILCYDIAQKK